MKKFFLTIVLLISISLISCSNDSDSDGLNAMGDIGCKTCDDVTDSEAVIEVCDNNDDTVTITVSVSGINVYNEILEIESSENFSSLECSDFDFSGLDI